MGSYIDTYIRRCEYKLSTWVLTTVEWEVVAIISRCTSSIPEDDVFPRLLYCDSMCSLACSQHSQAWGRRSQAFQWSSRVLPGLWLALPDLLPVLLGALRCTWRPLHKSSNLWDMTTLGFWSDNSQTLPEAPSDQNSFCGCHLITTWLGQQAIWLVDLSKAMVWRHHRPEVVEIVNPGVLFKERHYPVHQMLKHIEIGSMQSIRYDNRCWGHSLYIPKGAFWGSNCWIIQMLSCCPSLHITSISCENHLLQV